MFTIVLARRQSAEYGVIKEAFHHQPSKLPVLIKFKDTFKLILDYFGWFIRF